MSVREIGLFLVLAMFWNLENFYDTYDDPRSADEDFTPKGSYHWTWEKFGKKRDGIAKTIISIRDEYGNYPPIIGFAEVENRFVLRELVENTPLAALEYEVIHRDSPDRRGIDVGLIYRKSDFRPLGVKACPVRVPQEPSMKTRDILYVKGVLYGTDTLHLLVNHWPSKRGERSVSDRNRMTASHVVSHIVDSLLIKDAKAKVVVMGDLNDTQYSEAVLNLANLENLSNRAVKGKNAEGSYKYKESWDIIDHILVSETMKGYKGRTKMHIFEGNLLVKDDTYLGYKPLRTFQGPRYLGGTSDHLPVLLISEGRK